MGKKGEGAAATANNVYVLDKQYAWVPARLEGVEGDKARVQVARFADEDSIMTDKDVKGWEPQTVNLKHYPGKTLPLQNVRGGVLNEKEDMVDLPYLHEVSEISVLPLDSCHFFADPFSRLPFFTTSNLATSRRSRIPVRETS